jgi:hypothetical protein
MDRDEIVGFLLVWVLPIVLFLAFIAGAVVLYANWNYRWTQQCAAEHGVQMENTSGSRLCIRAPVEIVTIAARPW